MAKKIFTMLEIEQFRDENGMNKIDESQRGIARRRLAALEFGVRIEKENGAAYEPAIDPAFTLGGSNASLNDAELDDVGTAYIHALCLLPMPILTKELTMFAQHAAPPWEHRTRLAVDHTS